MNLRIETPNELLAGLTMPSMVAVDQIDLGEDDWLIVCAGFEERSLGLLKGAAGLGKGFSVLLVTYSPHIDENRDNEIRNFCESQRLTVVELEYSREDPTGFGDVLLEFFEHRTGRIFIDVSAMSRLLIVQALVALGNRVNGLDRCWIAYAEAADYLPNYEEATQELNKSESDPTFSILFLSSGVFDVTILPELSSSAPSGPQTRLIAFPSFDAHHLIAVRSEIQPSRLIVIEGVPPSKQNEWRESAVAQINKLDVIEGIERFRTSTLDYKQTLRCLLDIYANHGVQDRIIVSPTGSKMQTVAVGLLKLWVKDVQIVYPSPQGFCRPSRYTMGVGQSYIMPLAAFSLKRTSDKAREKLNCE